jgi:hypothetical protein
MFMETPHNPNFFCKRQGLVLLVLCSSLNLIVISGSGFFFLIIIFIKVLEIKEPSVSVINIVLDIEKPLDAVFLKFFRFKRASSFRFLKIFKEIGSFQERIGASLIY